MDNYDKIFEQFKEAADNQELADFSSKDKVWSRLEDKLDHKVLKKKNTQWKKIAIAASVLLVFTLGYQVFKPQTPIITTNSEIAIDLEDTKKNENETPIVTSDVPNPIIKENAQEILQKQTERPTAVAIQETEQEINPITEEDIQAQKHLTTIAKKESVQSMQSRRFNKGKAFEAVGVHRNNDAVAEDHSEAAKQSEAKIIGNASAPLVVLDGKAITGKEAAQINSIREGVAKVNAQDDKEVVILKEPLYIINGHYYSEEELFGPNPTSPYAPLNQQEIETILILEGEKAVANYGKKGEKGVVVITTKDRKPAKASTKKSE